MRKVKVLMMKKKWIKVDKKLTAKQVMEKVKGQYTDLLMVKNNPYFDDELGGMIKYPTTANMQVDYSVKVVKYFIDEPCETICFKGLAGLKGKGKKQTMVQLVIVWDK